MSHLRCRQLIEPRIAQWAEIYDILVGYQKKKFTPPAMTPVERYRHLRTFQLPARTITEDLEGTHSLFSGVFAMNIITPRFTGPAEAGFIVKELFDLFTANLELTATDGFKVTITSPVTESGIIEGDVDDTTPTSFEYEARVVR